MDLMDFRRINGTSGDLTSQPMHMLMPGGQGDNDTAEMTYFDPDRSSAYVFSRRVQTVVIPFICVLGVVGNVLAIGTFLSTSLRTTSCCLYLAAKSFFDIGFLLSLSVMWLYQLRVPLLTTTGVCQVTVYLTYVCGCLSVWFVVLITLENFVRFTRPRMVPRHCTVFRARRLIPAMTIFAAILYNFSLWTTGVVVAPDGTLHCTSLLEFENIVTVLTLIDTALTLVLPSLIMIFLILAIVVKVVESFKRKKRLRSVVQRAHTRRRLTPEGKMTTFLFAISVIFLLLNTPTHAIRLKMMIELYLQGTAPSYNDWILQRFFEVLFYLNFSTNCLVYMVFGENFRHVFLARYLDRCLHKGNIHNEESDVSPILLHRRTHVDEPSLATDI